MTTIEYAAPDGTFGKIEECYRLTEERAPVKKQSLWQRVELKEAEIKENLQQRGFEILSCKSELITKRRYKRRIAKKLLKLKKEIGDE